MRIALNKSCSTLFLPCWRDFLSAKLVFVLLCHKITVFVNNSGRRIERVNLARFSSMSVTSWFS